MLHQATTYLCRLWPSGWGVDLPSHLTHAYRVILYFPRPTRSMCPARYKRLIAATVALYVRLCICMVYAQMRATVRSSPTFSK